jgi:hypothetical protein
MLRVRHPDGHGVLRRVLQIATASGFMVDDLATGSAGADDGHQPDGVIEQRTT